MTAFVVARKRNNVSGYVSFSVHKYITHCNINSYQNPIYLSPCVLPYLDAKVASVDVITQKEIFGCGRVSADFEQLHQVVILSMNVAAHCQDREGS